jgi:hypothetical protein
MGIHGGQSPCHAGNCSWRTQAAHHSTLRQEDSASTAVTSCHEATALGRQGKPRSSGSTLRHEHSVSDRTQASIAQSRQGILATRRSRNRPCHAANCSWTCRQPRGESLGLQAAHSAMSILYLIGHQEQLASTVCHGVPLSLHLGVPTTPSAMLHVEMTAEECSLELYTSTLGELLYWVLPSAPFCPAIWSCWSFISTGSAFDTMCAQDLMSIISVKDF